MEVEIEEIEVEVEVEIEEVDNVKTISKIDIVVLTIQIKNEGHSHTSSQYL